jgi:hypothetical protein
MCSNYPTWANSKWKIQSATGVDFGSEDILTFGLDPSGKSIQITNVECPHTLTPHSGTGWTGWFNGGTDAAGGPGNSATFQNIPLEFLTIECLADGHLAGSITVNIPGDHQTQPTGGPCWTAGGGSLEG